MSFSAIDFSYFKPVRYSVAAECGIAFMGVIPLCAAPEMTQSIIFVLDFHISVEKVIPWLSDILVFDITYSFCLSLSGFKKLFRMSDVLCK